MAEITATVHPATDTGLPAASPTSHRGDTPRGASAGAEAGPQVGTVRVKRGMAEMLKGGVIMDVVTPEQAKIAEDAGAVAVMALERVPADIRAQGGGSLRRQPTFTRPAPRPFSVLFCR